MHAAPALFLPAIVGAAWRWEWLGGIAFIGLGLAYAMIVGGRADWTLVISGPLLTVGVLFLCSWQLRRGQGEHRR